ncbi:5174_t:CDS:2, partial [Racocetra fulgida]
QNNNVIFIDEEIIIDNDLSSNNFNFLTEEQAFKQALEKNSKEKDETFEECARREALEEANIKLKELIFVCFQEGFRKFSDRNT